MYKNVGKKIKALASITAVLGIIAGIVLGIILLVDGSTLEGVLMLILLPILSWISCLTLYAFGDIVIKINHIAKTVCGDIENEEEEEEHEEEYEEEEEEYEEEEEEYEEEDENDKG